MKISNSCSRNLKYTRLIRQETFTFLLQDWVLPQFEKQFELRQEDNGEARWLLLYNSLVLQLSPLFISN